MALPSVFRKNPSAIDQLAETRAIIAQQALEIARLTKRLDALEAHSAGPVATNGPIPADAASATSGRALMRLIATRLGKNEDSIRKSLVDHSAFERVRAQSAATGLPITRNMPFLAWLADNLETAWPTR